MCETLMLARLADDDLHAVPAGKYNALMQFLLRLKRVQLKMDAAWQSLGTKQLRQGLGRSTRTRQMNENSAADTP